MNATQLHDRLVEVVRPVVDEVGLDLESLLVQPAGRRRVVRVVVDRDGGVSSDDLAETSREVSRVLDDSDAMGGGAYTLEVSSPGVDRPLTEPRHWRRAAGRLVRAPLLDDAGEETGTEVRGRVTAAGDDGVDLDTEGTSTRYAYDRLGRGRVELEFRRAKDETDDETDETDETDDSTDDGEEGAQ